MTTPSAPNHPRPNRLGIEMLTLLGMNPVNHVRLAADLGCVSISSGLTSLPMAMFGRPELPHYQPWSLRDDAQLRRELKAALEDTGIHIALGEGFGVRPGVDLADRASELDIMAGLGTLRINAISVEPDIARTHDQLAVLADMVLDRGMVFCVEFAPTNVLCTLPMALEAAGHVGFDKAGIMLDAMHLFRSGGTLDDVRALPKGLLRYAQLADAPAVSTFPTYMEEAMFNRLVPGEGELPLAELLTVLPADLEVGVEVPNLATIRDDSPRDHAARAVAGARALGY